MPAGHKPRHSRKAAWGWQCRRQFGSSQRPSSPHATASTRFQKAPHRQPMFLPTAAHKLLGHSMLPRMSRTTAPSPQPRQNDRRIRHFRYSTRGLRRHRCCKPERRYARRSGRGLRRLPGPVPKASASRRGLPRVRSTSCPCIIFRPREPGIGLVARRGFHPPVIPPSPACGLLQFFRCRASGECLVGWRLRARPYGSRILFRWVGDGKLCSRVLTRALDRN